MPIRVNLLVEAKIAEELRRRDPVKWAIFAGVFLVALALVWSSSLQLESMISKKDLSLMDTEIMTKTNEYENVMANEKEIVQAKDGLAALDRLSASRFLQGNLLNALQHSTMDDVQLMRIKVNQTYSKTPPVLTKTNNGHVIPGHPGTATEKIMVLLDAKDSSANPGDKVNKFKNMLPLQPYFKTMLNQTNGIQLISLSAPQTGKAGRPYVLFTLECDFPDQTR